MLAYRHFLKARLAESLTAVIIPLDDSVLFVRLFTVKYSPVSRHYSWCSKIEPSLPLTFRPAIFISITLFWFRCSCSRHPYMKLAMQ